jgi:hypothetical protein
MAERRDPRASIGAALLGSAVVILVMAALTGVGAIDIAAGLRPAVVAALVAVAIVDAVIGLWFLRRGR